MPNLKQHLAISIVASGATYLAMCRYYGRRADFGELLICEVAGVLSGVAPDVLEPAVHPNHRAFGHSLGLAAALTKFAVGNCDKDVGNRQEFSKVLLAVMTGSYICHLIADGFTPKGLPLLGR